MSRRRAVLAALLTGLAVALAVVALIVSYAGRAVLQAEPFADRAVAALSDPAVSADVADHAADALVSSQPDLVSVRPLIRALVGAVVDTRAFAAVFRRAVVEAHDVIVRRGGGTTFVNVADAGVLVQGVLERFAPAAASKLGLDRVAKLLTLHPGAGARDAIDLAKSVYGAVWGIVAAALLLAAAALGISADRPRTLARLGFGLAGGGLSVAAFYLIGGAVVRGVAAPGRGAAAGALWQAFLDGLQVQAMVLATAGAVLAAAATVVRRAGNRGEQPVSVRDRLIANGGPLRNPAARTGLALAAGLVMLLEPIPTVRVVVLLAGLSLLYVGGRGALSILAGPWTSRKRDAPAAPGGGKGTAGTPLADARARWIAPGIALITVAGAIALLAGGTGDEAPAAAVPPTCNGAAALCHRRLDEVVFPATHNSMASVTIRSWLFGQQDGTIRDQLGDGIRGLLIDTYYGEQAGTRVRTDLSSLPKRAVAERELGATAVGAAESIRARIGRTATGPRQIYLCHGFCELGAVSLASALGDLRAFLLANPGEVVVIINQDEGVTPTDIAGALGQAGLLKFVYRGALGPFPTLRKMIDSGQRLVVMAENDAGDIPWYHLAYEHALQETPFRFTSPAQLTDASRLTESCRPNRGPASAPLFLINHWIDTTPAPRSSNAKLVNARAALLQRAETCRKLRGHLPNLIAVDFFRQGDVTGVARTLNGLGS